MNLEQLFICVEDVFDAETGNLLAKEDTVWLLGFLDITENNVELSTFNKTPLSTNMQEQRLHIHSEDFKMSFTSLLELLDMREGK